MICVPAAGRLAFRVGACDRNSREQREDGADDHNSEPQTGSLCRTLTRAAQSPGGEDPSRIHDGEMFIAKFKDSRENALSAPQ
jgi:hypothetical protein